MRNLFFDFEDLTTEIGNCLYTLGISYYKFNNLTKRPTNYLYKLLGELLDEVGLSFFPESEIQ